MNLVRAAHMLVGLALVVGCVPSVHPLYTEDVLTSDDGLLGTWGKDPEKAWTFSAAGKSSYRLAIGPEENGDVFTVHVVSLGTNTFLDLYPAGKIPRDDFYRMHLFPVHTFMLVRDIGADLELAFLQPKWLQRYLDALPQAIRHEQVEDGILLTASSKELQSFFATHVGTKGAFKDADPLPGDKPVQEEVEEPAVAKDSPERRQTRQRMTVISRGIDLFRKDTGSVPSRLPGLVRNTGMYNWSGPYMRWDRSRPIVDAWGTPFAYHRDGTNAFHLRSAGPDMTLDTADDETME